MKTATIIQARSTSTRFPGKVLAHLGNRNIKTLDLLTQRLSPFIQTIIAIPEGDQSLIDYCKDNGRLHYYEGDPINVRKRVLDAAHHYRIDTIIDITADCPLIDPYHVKILRELVESGSYHYASNVFPRSWPDGFDVQVYSTRLLQKAHNIIPHAPHCGWQIMNLYKQNELFHRDFKWFNYPAPPQMKCPKMRLTLDTPEDAIVIGNVIDNLTIGANAIKIINYMQQHPEIQAINKNIRTKHPSEG